MNETFFFCEYFNESRMCAYIVLGTILESFHMRFLGPRALAIYNPYSLLYFYPTTPRLFHHQSTPTNPLIQATTFQISFAGPDQYLVRAQHSTSSPRN